MKLCLALLAIAIFPSLGVAQADYDAPVSQVPPTYTARPEQLEIRSTLPIDADKTKATNALRGAAESAGCETAVVEMEPTPPGEPMKVRVWCRR